MMNATVKREVRDVALRDKTCVTPHRCNNAKTLLTPL